MTPAAFSGRSRLPLKSLLLRNCSKVVPPPPSSLPPSLAASAVPARRRRARAGGRDDDKGRAIPTRVLGGENEDEVGGTWRGDGEMEIEERGGTEMTELFD